MSVKQPRADGSSARDAGDVVRIDRSIPAQRWRYTCPHGHLSWAPTNNHLWCKACRQVNENGRNLDPEHYELIDQKTGERINWARVRLVEDG